VIDVDEREFQRVGPRVLLSLEDEARRRTEEAKPTPVVRDRDFEERREGERAWAALARKARAIVSERHAKAVGDAAKLAAAQT
jgi:hypothetical protein